MGEKWVSGCRSDDPGCCLSDFSLYFHRLRLRTVHSVVHGFGGACGFGEHTADHKHLGQPPSQPKRPPHRSTRRREGGAPQRTARARQRHPYRPGCRSVREDQWPRSRALHHTPTQKAEASLPAETRARIHAHHRRARAGPHRTLGTPPTPPRVDPGRRGGDVPGQAKRGPSFALWGLRHCGYTGAACGRARRVRTIPRPSAVSNACATERGACEAPCPRWLY